MARHGGGAAVIPYALMGDEASSRAEHTGLADAGDMVRPPRVLLVDTSLAGMTEPSQVWDEVIDYSALAGTPRWIRACEQFSRIDYSLAGKAITESVRFDLLVAGSEKVGIPLAMRPLSRPVVCVVHQVASPVKRRLLKWLDLPSRWIRIGYQCTADRDVLVSYYGIPPSRLVKFKTAPLGTFSPTAETQGEYVLSVGTSKRDYRTLLEALDALPGTTTRLYLSSRFLDPYRGRMPTAPRSWVERKEPAALASMPDVYRSARLVVIPIENDTCQYSAGATVALEAMAAGKAVVATRTPGMSDFVIDGITGLLVPGGDAVAMRAAIARLWNDPQEAAEMGRAGRALAEQEFNPAVIDKEIRRAYAEACEEFRTIEHRRAH